MGKARNQDLLHGIVVHDATITPGNLTEKDDTTVLLRSAYTQASPKAGIAADGRKSGDTEYQMGLHPSGTADEDASLEILTQAGGHPIPEDGGYVWRNLADGDGADEYKGADSFVSVTDFDEVFYTTDAVNTPTCNVIRLQNGDLLATGIEVAAGVVRVFYYTTSAGSWTTVGPYDPGVDEASHTQYALAQLPTGRVLIYWQTADQRNIDCRYSDDNGATWADYAQRVLDEHMDDGSGAVIAPTRLQVGYSNGQMLLMYAFTDSAARLNLAQYASIDDGHTFTLVKNDFYSATTYPSCEPSIVAVPSGGFAVAVLDKLFAAGVYRAKFYRIGSAYTPLDEGDQTNIWAADDNPSVRALTAWLDEDDILYALVTDADFVNPNVSYNAHLYQSLDFGATVSPYLASTWNFGDLLFWAHSFDGASTGGRAVVLTRWTDTGGGTHDETSVAAIGLGGYGGHTLPTSRYDNTRYFDEVASLSFGPDNAAAATDAGCYMPMGVPDVMGWTRVTAGAPSTVITDNAELSITTSGGIDSDYYYRTHTGAVGAVMAQFSVRIPTGSGALAASNCYVRLKLGDNSTYGFDVTINLADTGYRVIDNEAGGTVASVAVALTTRRWFRVLLSATAASVRVWTSPDGHIKPYALEVTGTGLTDRGGAGYHNFMYFGNLTVGTDTSYWRNVAYSMEPYLWSPSSLLLGGGWSNPAALRAKSYSSRRTLIDDGIFIAADGGPTTMGESWQIDADYDYPLSAIYPGTSPSPSRKWRSTGVAADVNLVWDTEKLYTDDGITDNNLVCVQLLGANFRTAYFEVWTGAAWTTLATLDAADGYSLLKYARHGRKVTPNTGEAHTGDRYIWYEDHVGDTIDLGAPPGGDPPGQQYAKIVHNTEGAWVGSGDTTKRPVIVMDDDYLDGGEAATGTCHIWRQNFGAVLAGFDTTLSKYRLQIPAQSTADGYFELGNVVIGPVAVLGMQYDRGYAYTHLHPLTAETLTDGSQRVRKDGPEQRRFTFSLTTGAVDLTSCNLDDPSPDYRTAEAGNAMAVATMFDTTRTIEGLIRRTHASNEPALILTAIERDTTGGAGVKASLLTQRRTMLWCRIQTDPYVEAILGNESKTELERYQLITAEEVV